MSENIESMRREILKALKESGADYTKIFNDLFKNETTTIALYLIYLAGIKMGRTEQYNDLIDIINK